MRGPPADLPYRPCVGLALFNRDGRVFIGRRRSDTTRPRGGTHDWQMPQGGIDRGEEPGQAALRELFEETSVRSATLIGTAPDWYSYELPARISGRSWKGRYRGQTQLWFAFRFTGDESEIDVLKPGGGRHKSEFDAWRWEKLEALPEMIIPFKRPVYEKVVAAFGHLAVPDV